MIRITAMGSDYRKGFTVEGHADYAEHGQDIVCASVSTLVQSTIIGLNMNCLPMVTKSRGYTQIDVTGRTNKYSNCILDMFMYSLREIAEQYPHHIQMEEYYID